MTATYPRRWLLALLFASIVALTAGSFSQVWAGTNSGGTGGTGATGPGELDIVDLDVATITVPSGFTRTFTATAVDVNGNPATGVTFAFSIVSGGGAIGSSSGVFTAPTGPATVVVKVTATQGSFADTDTATVTVLAPPPAPTPTPVPVNPAPEVPPPPPPSVPDAEIETITPVNGGSVSLEIPPQAGGDAPARTITVDVKPSSVSGFVALEVAPVVAADVPPVPAALRLKVSGTVVDLTFTNIDGTPIDGFVADRPVTITISYSQADADAAGGAQNLVILKYDEVAKSWVGLPTSVNLAKQTMSAEVKTFSLFGVGIPQAAEVAPTATPVQPTATPQPPEVVALPATGDVAPSTATVIAFIIFGLALMTGGLAVIRRWQTGKSRA